MHRTSLAPGRQWVFHSRSEGETAHFEVKVVVSSFTASDHYRRSKRIRGFEAPLHGPTGFEWCIFVNLLTLIHLLSPRQPPIVYRS